MYLTSTLTLPFVDADRRGGNAPKPSGLSYRARFAVAFVVFVAVWLIARLSGYWMP